MTPIINKPLYDALLEAGVPEDMASSAASHDVVSELVQVRNELVWIKKVGGWSISALAASVAAVWWQLFEMNRTLGENGALLTQILDKLA